MSRVRPSGLRPDRNGVSIRTACRSPRRARTCRQAQRPGTGGHRGSAQLCPLILHRTTEPERQFLRLIMGWQSREHDRVRSPTADGTDQDSPPGWLPPDRTSGEGAVVMTGKSGVAAVGASLRVRGRAFCGAIRWSLLARRSVLPCSYLPITRLRLSLVPCAGHAYVLFWGPWWGPWSPCWLWRLRRRRPVRLCTGRTMDIMRTTVGSAGMKVPCPRPRLAAPTSTARAPTKASSPALTVQLESRSTAHITLASK